MFTKESAYDIESTDRVSKNFETTYKKVYIDEVISNTTHLNS